MGHLAAHPSVPDHRDQVPELPTPRRPGQNPPDTNDLRRQGHTEQLTFQLTAPSFDQRAPVFGQRSQKPCAMSLSRYSDSPATSSIDSSTEVTRGSSGPRSWTRRPRS